MMDKSDATALESTARDIVGEGAETAGGAGAAPGETDGYSTCGVCGMIFPTHTGASQHERLVFPEWYHSIRIHLVTKSGWSEDEMVLVAREENRLVAEGRHLCGNMAANPRVNQDLFRAFPGRSADAINRHFNEFRGHEVFTCAQSGDAKTVSSTWHLGSVFVQPLCWRSFTGQGCQWR